MKQKTFYMENFIGVYDNYIMEEECEKAINIFETQDKFKNTVDRFNFENAPSLRKKDYQYFLNGANVDIWWSDLKTMMLNYNIAWEHYASKVSAKMLYDDALFHYSNLKIQKTLPGEGYHLWHIEHGKGFEMEPRAFVFTIYLNDVEEGGETEFLHFSKRLKPKKGRIAIWPAGFPYVHRGNPPLSGKKYILTSWMLIR